MRYEVLPAVKVELIMLCCGVPYSVEEEVSNCRRKRCVQRQPYSWIYVKKGYNANCVIV